MGTHRRLNRVNIAAAAAAVVLAASAVAGCSKSPAPFVAIPQVNGVRTADDGRTVLLTYSGGGCDAPAVTRIAQTASVVTLTASIGSTRSDGGCASDAFPRVVTFHLSSPLGARRVRNGLHGEPVSAFDGAVLTTPRWLPPGYTERTDVQTPDVAGSWSRSWTLPGTSGADQLVITQSPHRLPAPTGATIPGRNTVNGSPATVTRDPSRLALAVQWNVAGSPVSARVTDHYFGSRPAVTVTELLRIATGLPAGS